MRPLSIFERNSTPQSRSFGMCSLSPPIRSTVRGTPGGWKTWKTPARCGTPGEDTGGRAGTHDETDTVTHVTLMNRNRARTALAIVAFVAHVRGAQVSSGSPTRLGALCTSSTAQWQDGDERARTRTGAGWKTSAGRRDKHETDHTESYMYKRPVQRYCSAKILSICFHYQFVSV